MKRNESKSNETVMSDLSIILKALLQDIEVFIYN